MLKLIFASQKNISYAVEVKLWICTIINEKYQQCRFYLIFNLWNVSANISLTMCLSGLSHNESALCWSFQSNWKGVIVNVYRFILIV